MGYDPGVHHTLLHMPGNSVTKVKADALEEAARKKRDELEVLKKKTPSLAWEEDLAALKAELLRDGRYGV